MTALLCLALISTCLLHVSVAQTDPNAKYQAIGSTLSASIFSEWMFAYNLMKPSSTFQYKALGPLPGINAITLTNSVDFATSDVALTAAQKAQSCPGNDTLQIPILATPMVFFYNLPYGSLGFNGLSSVGGPLILSRRTAAAIWSHNITNWRDPEILADQDPDVAALLPNTSIQYVVRSNAQIILAVVQKAMNAFSVASGRYWKWGTTGVWPASFYTDPGVLTTTSPVGVRNLVSLTPNSLGIAPYAEVLQDGQNNFARMINKRGELLQHPDMGPALDNAVWDADMATDSMIDNSASGTWPFGAMNYVLLRIKNFKTMDCETRRDLLLFFNWALTSDQARARMKALGYSALPPTMTQAVLERLKTLKCNAGAASFLEPSEIDQHASGAYTAVYALAFIFGITTSAMVVYYLYRDWSKISSTAAVFFSVLLIGSIFNYAAVINFYSVPKTDEVCQSRLWLAVLGFTMMLSALFCRGYQIYAVAETAKNLGRKVPHATIQVGGNMLVILLQVIILAVWNAVDMFEARHNQIDDLNLRYGWICTSTNKWLWWGIELAFLLVLLGFGLYVVYKTWDLKHMVKESKWISVSIYNCLVVTVLLVALFSVMEATDDMVFWLGGGSTLFLTATTMFALFLPRVLTLKELADMSGTSGSTSHTHHSKNNQSVASPGSQIDKTTKNSDSRRQSYPPPEKETGSTYRTSKFGPGPIPTGRERSNSLSRSSPITTPRGPAERVITVNSLGLGEGRPASASVPTASSLYPALPSSPQPVTTSNRGEVSLNESPSSSQSYGVHHAHSPSISSSSNASGGQIALVQVASDAMDPIAEHAAGPSQPQRANESSDRDACGDSRV